MGDTVIFKHSGNAGDIIAAMAGIRQICEKLGRKATLLLRLNTPAFYYSGAPQHPVQDARGQQVMLNRKQYDMLKPLLLAQDYVAGVGIYTGQKVMVDLDRIRGEVAVGMPNTQIQHWYGYAFPDMWTDTSEAWMGAPGMGGDSRKILINRTSRYVNENLDFHFLKAYADRGELLFTGLEVERDEFCERWGYSVELLKVGDFLDLAGHLAGARFVLCNQSFVYNLCEALKVPRVLEICTWAPNCTPTGAGAAAYMNQAGLEYWFGQMVERTQTPVQGVIGFEQEEKKYSRAELINWLGNVSNGFDDDEER